MKISIDRRSGSILILTLWVLGFLSVFALYTAINVRMRLEFLGRMEARNKLYLFADSGIKRAVTEIGKIDKSATYTVLGEGAENDPAVFGKVNIGDGYYSIGYSYKGNDYRPDSGGTAGTGIISGLADVQAKLNINKADLSELSLLIENAAGADEKTAAIIASSIIDWRDSDNLALPNGAEDAYYHSLAPAYNCKNAPFETLEELGYIRGMSKTIFDKIVPYITVYGSGKVNINTASRTVLSAFGLSDALLDDIMTFRCGPDGEPGTRDDRVFTSTNSLAGALSQISALNPAEIAELNTLSASGKLCVFSDTFRIESVSGLNGPGGKCMISCVFRKNLDPALDKTGWILEWRTEYFM